MRYNIGEKFLVIAYGYENFRNQTLIPFRFSDDKPSKIFIKELTVSEHHKVGDGYLPDGEKEYDGYVLVDSEGKIFHNQYPVAHYGQLSDAGNYQFEISCEGSIPEEISNLVLNENTSPVQFELLTENVRRIVRGCNNETLPENLKNNLHWLLAEIEKEAKQLYPNFKYEVKGLEVKNKNGETEIYNDIKVVDISY